MHLIKPTIGGQRDPDDHSHDPPAHHPAPSARTIAEAAILAEGPAEGVPRSLYIHTPFCEHKCHYCDFYSIVDTQDRQEAFTQRLIDELRAWSSVAAGSPLRTIFIGGGTPSLLRVDLWQRLLRVLHDVFDLSAITERHADTEFTVECNPESVTAELMAVLRDGGVSRISMGAQSFDPGVLKRLERLHRPERVAVAIDLAAEAGIERRSIDLIYAVPGQTEAMWANDLRTALALPIDHVSAYNLTYEPNTALTARLARGEFVPADEDIELVMFEMARDLTREAGLDRYEVSNYARPGGASRHNLAYWRQEPWIAAGPSASGHLAGWRWKNTPRLDTYLAGNDGGFAPAIDIESPDPVRALAERIMTGLRLDEGVDGARALAEAEALSPKRAAKLRRVVERHIDDGRFDGARGSLDGRWVLGESGILIADGIAADCIGVLLG